MHDEVLFPRFRDPNPRVCTACGRDMRYVLLRKTNFNLNVTFPRGKVTQGRRSRGCRLTDVIFCRGEIRVSPDEFSSKKMTSSRVTSPPDPTPRDLDSGNLSFSRAWRGLSRLHRREPGSSAGRTKGSISSPRLGTLEISANCSPKSKRSGCCGDGGSKPPPYEVFGGSPLAET